MNKNKNLQSHYSFSPWPYNPLVTLIRLHSITLINELIENYQEQNGYSASHFDLIIQIMLISCSYDPHEIWIGKSEDLDIATELVAKGSAHEATDVLEDAILKGHVKLNEALINTIGSVEIKKLHLLQMSHKKIYTDVKKQMMKMQNLALESKLTNFRLIKSTKQSGISHAEAIEKNTQQKIIFRKISLQLSHRYAKIFHYLHETRDDDMLAFGAFFEGSTKPFAWVSYAPIGRKYKQTILKKSGINPLHSLELTRAWNIEDAPKNTLSMLFTYAHAFIQHHWLHHYHIHFQAVLTDVNPNLGFKGSAFRAVGFGLIGEKPTVFHYLIDNMDTRNYTTRRALQQLLQIDTNRPLRYMQQSFPLLPTKELAVTFDGKRRLQPHTILYSVNSYEFLSK